MPAPRDGWIRGPVGLAVGRMERLTLRFSPREPRFTCRGMAAPFLGVAHQDRLGRSADFEFILDTSILGFP